MSIALLISNDRLGFCSLRLWLGADYKQASISIRRKTSHSRRSFLRPWHCRFSSCRPFTCRRTLAMHVRTSTQVTCLTLDTKTLRGYAQNNVAFAICRAIIKTPKEKNPTNTRNISPPAACHQRITWLPYCCWFYSSLEAADISARCPSPSRTLPPEL